MVRVRVLLGVLLAVLAGGWLLTAEQAAPAQQKPTHKLEPVAETRLLMEGLNQANFRGAERLLKEKPADAETWTFIRGQALLIAETGNLLMLRPPKNQGQDAWMTYAAALREAATDLARQAANRDFARSQAALSNVANHCTLCHKTFRVPVKVIAFAEPAERKTE